MLRLSLVIALVVVVCNAQLAAKIPIFCRESSSVDSLKANDVDSSKQSLTESQVKSILGGGVAPINLDNPILQEAQPQRIAKEAISSSDANQATAAKLALRPATGNIIAQPTSVKCPLLTSSYGPQELCPSQREVLKTFYSRGFCYVLFPYWQKKYYTRCRCKECRVDCVSKSRRNLCVPERYSYTSVWAICRSGWTWQIRNVRVRLAQGKCECKSYRRRCFG